MPTVHLHHTVLSLTLYRRLPNVGFVLLEGWGTLKQPADFASSPLSSRVKFVESIPHEWLFPRVEYVLQRNEINGSRGSRHHYHLVIGGIHSNNGIGAALWFSMVVQALPVVWCASAFQARWVPLASTSSTMAIVCMRLEWPQCHEW